MLISKSFFHRGAFLRTASLAVLLGFSLATPNLAHASSLEEELTRIRQESPQIRSGQERLLAAQQNVESRKMGLYPRVTLSTIMARKQITDVRGDKGSKNIRDIELSLAQKLYDGNATNAGIAEGEDILSATNAELTRTINTTLSRGAESYIEVLKFSTLIELVDQALVMAREEEQLVRQENATGAATKKQIINAQKDIVDTIARRSSYQRQLARASGEYQRHFGSMPNIGTMSTPRLDSNALPNSVEELLGTLSESPSYQTQLMRANAVEKRIDIARSAMLPQVDVTLSHRADTDNITIAAGGPEAPETKETALSLNVSWELSALLTNQPAVNAAQNNFFVEKTRAAATLQSLRGQAMDRWNGYRAILEEIAAVRDLVAYDNELIALTEQEVASGGSTERALSRTKLNAMRNQYRLTTLEMDKLIAEIKLAESMGRTEELVR